MRALSLFRTAMIYSACLLAIGLFALRLRSYSPLPTVPVVITTHGPETTYTFESFGLDVPHNEDVVECRSSHGDDLLRVISSQNGSMELVVRGIHGGGSDQEARMWQADVWASGEKKPPFHRTQTVFYGKPATKAYREGRFVAALGRSDGQTNDLQETITIVAWRDHILSVVASFHRGDRKASIEAEGLIAHLKLCDSK